MDERWCELEPLIKDCLKQIIEGEDPLHPLTDDHFAHYTGACKIPLHISSSLEQESSIKPFPFSSNQGVTT